VIDQLAAIGLSRRSSDPDQPRDLAERKRPATSDRCPRKSG
jgi:hypothetical protein